MNAIEVKHIVKTYGKVKALNDVTLSIPEGETFGLIGADGAGKTSLFRILTTLLLPDSGTATVEGLDTVKDYRAIRRITGYMPGRFSLYGDLTVRENLDFFASIFGTTVEKNRYLIDEIYKQIEPFNNRRAAALSGGMKQKLGLCCSLIHAPKVLFLDEPTTGVDPVSRKELWDMLGHLRERGVTIMASTPYMDEAKQCERMAFIKEGRIIETDTPKNIVSNFGEPLYAISADNMHKLLGDVRNFEGISSCYAFGDTHHFTCSEKAEGNDSVREHSTISPANSNNDVSLAFKKLDDYLSGIGYKNVVIKNIEPTIEDCYMKLSADNNG